MTDSNDGAECWLCRECEEFGEKCPMHCGCAACCLHCAVFTRALKLGLSRGLELAKEHAEAVVVFECGECDGEGRVDDENSSGDVECSKCEGSGTVTHRQKTIDFTAADAAVEREAK